MKGGMEMGKRFGYRGVVVVLFLAGLIAGQGSLLFSAEDVSRPEVAIVKCTVPPVIDGSLEDECWQKAAKVGPFLNFHASEGAPKEETFAYLACDEDNLYLGFRCNESKPQDILAQQKERDSHIWEDDCIEVFIDTNYDRRSYYHLIVNTLGVQYDEMEKNNPEWDGDWQAKVKTGNDYWSLEIAIPFRILLIESNVWGINFNRERYQSPRESSTWSPVRLILGFHDPERFGTLKGLEIPFYTSLKIKEITTEKLIGSDKAKILLENKGKERQLSLKVNVTSPGKDVKTHSNSGGIPEGGKAELVTVYQLAESGEHRLVLDLIDADAKKTVYTLSRRVGVPELLAVNISATSYYEDDKTLPLEVMVNAAEELREKIDIQVEIKDAGGKVVSEKKVKPLEVKNYLTCDISGLSVGKYSLCVKLLESNAMLGEAKKEIEKIGGFW